ncbi:MAG TPA: ThiF family adenylyltransferase [Pseudonocardiaceae bacterium]|nr:ThiF family adenylyltransferase [Pseudonocardiaceae bacterium]
MSSLKFTNPDHWTHIEQHLARAPGERFAFALTKTLSNSATGPVLLVVDVILIGDHEIERGPHGWYVADHAIDRVHNHAVTENLGMVEFHNHALGPPGFSSIDEAALAPMVDYVLDLGHGTPYGAAVWVEGAVRADWWRPAGSDGVERRPFDTVTVLGDHLRVINADAIAGERFVRQLPLLGPNAQATLAAMRVAVVGAGGTGSHVALNLAYLGFCNVFLLDDDCVEITNLNRLVTADHADLNSPKTIVAGRRMRAIDPRIQIHTRPGLTPTGMHPELGDVDLIIGCVDHDGPRHRLNEIAIDTQTPYIDIATGVDSSHTPTALGGRVTFVSPGGPCLTCLDELDSAEVARWAKPASQQALDRQHGYGTNTPNPSVVYLNGLAVHAAFAELAAWLSGSRPPAQWLDIDLLGNAARPGLHVAPRELPDRNPGCVDCGAALHVQ